MQIILTTALVTTIVLILTSLVLIARRILVPSGEVSILINNSRRLPVPTGGKLLWTLAEHGIHLPAACGGRGSCGQCRLVVGQGGGEALMPETSHLNKRDLRNHWRLACMVAVREDLAISLPESILDARRWRCRVQSSRCISTYQKEIVLALDEADDFNFEPGSYVLLEAPAGRNDFAEFEIDDEYRQEWRRNNLFALDVNREKPTVRAYSIANHPHERGIVTFVVRIALPPPKARRGAPPGKVSSYAYGLRPNDEVSISGPFGTFRARESSREMVFIGGGAGIAPLRSIVFDQLLNKRTKRKITFFYGARSLRDLCYYEEFEALASRYENFTWHVALSDSRPDDEWQGSTGFIHTVIYNRFLEKHPAPEECEYYVCGPPVMSNAVIGMLEDMGVDRDDIFLDDFGG